MLIAGYKSKHRPAAVQFITFKRVNAEQMNKAFCAFLLPFTAFTAHFVITDCIGCVYVRSIGCCCHFGEKDE